MQAGQRNQEGSQMEVSNDIITLITKDNKAFNIPQEFSKFSKFLADSIKLGKKVIILEVRSEPLELAIKFMEHYYKKEMVKIPENLSDTNQLCEFDFKLVGGMNYEQVFGLAFVADILEIDHLADITATRIAELINKKGFEDAEDNDEPNEELHQEEEEKEEDKEEPQ